MIWFSYILMTLLMFSGLFLIGLVLLQRGRGGGLAGAFGGMGGQSAFGTKAGDVFTRITIGVATAWILLCAGSVIALHKSTGTRNTLPETVEKKQDTSKSDRAKVDGKNDIDDEKDDEDMKEPKSNTVIPADKNEKKAEDAVKDKPASDTNVTPEVKAEEKKADDAKVDDTKKEGPTPEPGKPEEKKADPKPEAAADNKPKQ